MTITNRRLGVLAACLLVIMTGGYAYGQLQASLPAQNKPPDLFKTDPEGFTRARYPPADWPDRDFTVCRLSYTSVRAERDGSGWKTDYPYSEINLLIRFVQMTTTTVSWDKEQIRPNTWVVRLSDSKLY